MPANCDKAPMAIHLPEGLPAAEALRREGYEVCEVSSAVTAPPECLRVLLLNLMPDKQTTELQFARQLARSGFPVELVLLKPASHICKSAPAEHMTRFYRTWDTITPAEADGLIVTGAPLEHLPFGKVRYWDELCGIFNDARRCGLEQLFICWAAQAALNHHYGVQKRSLPSKAFGVFTQQVFSFTSPFVEGLNAQFDCPVSRHTEVCWSDLVDIPDLKVVAGSNDSGLCLLADQTNTAAYMFNHLEYDADTLSSEYRRDAAKCESAPIPKNYFPFDNPKALPQSTWREPAAVFFSNWTRMSARRRMANTFTGNAA